MFVIGTWRRRFNCAERKSEVLRPPPTRAGASGLDGRTAGVYIEAGSGKELALDLLSDLNEPQRRAVSWIDGPLLILAGAGSGKTRVITRRVAYLIRQGISPRSVLAVTFTNKAAGEMLRRVRELQTPPGATLCTFHSLCARLLREFSREANLSANFTIYDRQDQLKVVKGVMERLSLGGNLAPAAVHGTLSNAKNALQSCDEFAGEAGDFYTRTVAGVYREYEKALAANNAVDFDDLLLRMAFLLRDRPDIRETLSRRYRYILIDEYQDTNRAQYILTHGIAMDHENLCATGDPDQSIYAWRGADIRNILEFEADYPNAKVIRLEENYRSTQPILSAASRLIARNRMRKEKTLWSRRCGGADVRVLLCADEHDEAAELARRIAAYSSRGCAHSDIAVFYRVNSLSRLIEQTFLTSGIPYRVARGVEFYGRKEVKDVLAYLRVLVNGEDDVSLERIINTPARGIGQTTVNRLKEWSQAGGVSLLAACAQPERAGLGKAAAVKVAKFAETISRLSSDLARPVRQIMEDVVAGTGLEDAYGRDEEADAPSNIAELISTAAEFDLQNEGPPAEALADYLRQISLVSDVDHMEGSTGAVTLMTLHAAKGLEFPIVFILACEEGLLPFDRSDSHGSSGLMEGSPQLEEERRLAFVGMTRAKDELTLLCARSRMLRGLTRPQAASRFLNEIGRENVSVEDRTWSEPRRKGAAAGGASHRGGFYADSEERAMIEAAEAEHPFPPEYEHLREGCLVRHPTFGLGKVLKLAQSWPDTRATIHFEQWGPKKIVLAKTSLEHVTEY